MLKFIKNLFKEKQKKPYHPPYPQAELDNMRQYKNRQHKRAMKAQIKDPSDDIRKAGW
tara:strand:+ start:724 stop:897 length:174 start_codon:yes stop_codon:yes gene_type:complete